MSNFVDRLRETIGKSSVNAFARKCGLSEGQIRNYLKGAVPGLDKVESIAKSADVSFSWLATGDGEPCSIAQNNQDTYVSVPMMKARASAGGGALALDEDQEGWVKFDRSWLHNTWHLNPADLFTIGSIGESMEPTIKAGEYLLASRSERHLKLADGIYIVRLEGNVLVKRIQILPGQKIKISSDNPSYDPYEIKLDEGVDFDILGKVVLVHGVRKV